MSMSPEDQQYTNYLKTVDELALDRDVAGIKTVQSEINALLVGDTASAHATALLAAVNGYVLSIAGTAKDAHPFFIEARAEYNKLGLRWNALLMSLRIGEVLFSNAQYKGALAEYESVLQEYEQLGDEAAMARLAENMGLVHLRLGNLEQCATWYEQSLELQQKLQNSKGVLRLTANLGNMYLVRGEVDLALDNYLKALEGFENSGAKAPIAAITTNVGICYADKADYPKALQYLYRGLEVGKEIGHKVSLSATTGTLGEIYEACDDYEKALHWFEESLKISLEAARISEVCTKRLQLAVTLLHMGRLGDSLYQLETARQLALEIDSKRDLNRVNAYIAMIRLSQGATAEARRFINLAFEDSPHNGLVRDMLKYWMIEASICMAENAVPRCQQALDKATEIAKSMGAEKELSEVMLMQYRLYRAESNLERALKVLEEYIEVRDRFNGQQRQRHIAILEAEQRISEQTKAHQYAMAEERRLREQQRKLLTNMLPETIADRLIGGETMVADRFEEVSVLFLDLVNFTGLASRVQPEHILVLLNSVFGECDKIVNRYGLTKIKTIGDSYMAVCGAPTPIATSAVVTAMAAIEIRSALNALQVQIPDGYGDRAWIESVGDIEVRMGIHCGPVSAGIIGEERMAYDVWGDTVNIAARMEQTGSPGLIQVTEHFRNRVLELDPSVAHFVSRGQVEVKGRGPMETWWMQEHTV